MRLLNAIANLSAGGMLPWIMAAAFAAAVGVWGWGALRYNAGWTEGRAEMELDLRREAEATRERLRHADTGEGNADADLCWLAERMRMALPPGCE